MSIADEKNETIRLITGIESGTLRGHDAFQIAEKIDPVLLHYTFRYLRETYPPGHPDSQGVTERLVEISSAHPNLVASAKRGEEDPIREWFDDTYSMSDYRNKPDEMVEILYAKIDG